MPWTNNVASVIEVNTVIVIESIPGSGIFFYTPAPGPGNLVGSWTAAAGTDAYGNSYPRGLDVGFLQYPHVNIDTVVQGSQMPALIKLETASASQLAPGKIQFDSISSSNAYTVISSPVFKIGNIINHANASTEVFLESSGGNLAYVLEDDPTVYYPQLSWNNNGCQVLGTTYAIDPTFGNEVFAPVSLGVGNGQETWHTPTFGSGWSGTLQYMFTAEGSVTFKGNAVNGSAAAGQTMFTVTSFYAPSVARVLGSPSISVNASMSTIVVNTDGTVVLDEITAGDHTFSFDNARYWI